MARSRPSTSTLVTIAVILAIGGFWLYAEVTNLGEVGQTSDPQVPTASADCAKDGKFCGDLAATYDDARAGCGAFSPEQLRRQLGARSANAADIGEAFASAYQEYAYQAAFEGCVDAVLAQG